MSVDASMASRNGQPRVCDIGAGLIVQIVVEENAIADAMRPKEDIEQERAVVERITIAERVERLIGGQKEGVRSVGAQGIAQILVAHAEGLRGARYPEVEVLRQAVQVAVLQKHEQTLVKIARIRVDQVDDAVRALECVKHDGRIQQEQLALPDRK